MPERWTGEIVGAMHCNGISVKDLAEEMEVTRTYVSMVLHSKRKPPAIEARVREALNRILEARYAENKTGQTEARPS